MKKFVSALFLTLFFVCTLPAEMSPFEGRWTGGTVTLITGSISASYIRNRMDNYVWEQVEKRFPGARNLYRTKFKSNPFAAFGEDENGVTKTEDYDVVFRKGWNYDIVTYEDNGNTEIHRSRAPDDYNFEWLYYQPE